MSIENLIVFGISYEEISLEEREELYKIIHKNHIENKLCEKTRGAINLSTCLRIEYYIDQKEEIDDDYLKNLFPLFQKKVYVKRGMDACDYLFKVVCGFYSVIKGEDQILSQIKNSYLDALDKKNTSKLLNIVFNRAIELGKKFRTLSQISSNALSLEAISLRLIESKIDNLKEKNIFVLGIGDLSKSIIILLLKYGVKNVMITNRTYHTAEKLSEELDVELIDYQSKYDGLVRADIIISATSAPHIVVDYDRFKSLMDKKRKYIFLDLAVPRDIDSKLSLEENIDIYNLDNLWDKYRENSENRLLKLNEYGYLISEYKEKLLKSLEYYLGEVV